MRLWLTQDEIASVTILGGNVDPDRFLPAVEETQIRVLMPLLGTELYDKIDTGLATTLTGLYKTLYDDYLVPILRYESLAAYLEVAQYLVENGGIYKHNAENRTEAERNEVASLAQRQSVMATEFINRFYKWISKNEIPEYKTHQNEVNARKNIDTRATWHLQGYRGCSDSCNNPFRDP